MVGSSYAGLVADADGARTAAAPDRDLAGRRARPTATTTRPARAARCSCTCSGRCSCTPRTRRRSATTRPPSRSSGTACATCGELAAGDAVPAGPDAAARRAEPRKTLFDYYYRGAYDEFWAQECNDFERHFDRHADVPGTFTGGWFDPFAVADDRATSRRWRGRTAAAAADHGPVDPRRRCAATRRYVGDVDFGPEASGACGATSRSSCAGSTAGSRTSRPASRTSRRCGSSSWAAAAAPDARGQARPRRPLARRARVAAGARPRDDATTCTPTAALAPNRPRPTPRRAASPSTRTTRCRRSAAACAGIMELPADGAATSSQMWTRFLSRCRGCGTSSPTGPAHQKEAPEHLRRAAAVPAAGRPARRARLPDPAAAPSRSRSPGRSSSSSGSPRRRAGHRLHGQADRRLPAERRLPRRLPHEPGRLGHPLPLPRQLGARGADGARASLPGRDRAAADEQPVRRRPPHPAGHLEQQLPAPRPQPEHGRADGPPHAAAAAPTSASTSTPGTRRASSCRSSRPARAHDAGENK